MQLRMKLASTWFCTARRHRLSLGIKFAVQVATERAGNLGMNRLNKR